MDDGLIQIIFFLVVVAASMFDAVARKGKQRRGQLPPPVEHEQEMEESEVDARGPDRWSSAPSSERPIESYTGAGKEPYEEPYEEVVEEVEAERETADSMVPADLWAILTGQLPPAPPPPSQKKAPSESWERKPVETWEAAGTRPDVLEKPWSVWQAGAAGHHERPSWDLPTEVPAPIDRPLPVRPESESSPRRGVPAPASRSGRRRRSVGVRGLGTPSELRRAVILTEVFSAPLALRKRDEPWEPR